jgi:hypothetical protein
MDRTRMAVVGVAVDVVFMTTGVALGWFTTAELVLAAWMQTSVPIVLIPLILMWAAVRAPDHRCVDAGEPLVTNGQELRGRAAARNLAWFFPLHYGLFMGVIAMFLSQLMGGPGLFGASAITVVVLAARSIVANLPVAVADARFVRADGFASLAGKAKALLWRPYAQLFPLHLGTMALLWGWVDGDGSDVPAVAIIGLIAVVTFAGALIRYPDLDEASENSTEDPAGMVSTRDSTGSNARASASGAEASGSGFAAHRPPN